MSGLILLASPFYHELSHDEAQAWNISRAASLPWDVIANGRLEGHTPLWHAVLWPLTRSGNPQLMQLVGVAAWTIFAVLLFRDRPFPRVVLALLVIGYFPLFLFAVFVRPQVLLLALTAIVASSSIHLRGNVVARSALCGLLGFTSAFGAALSVGAMVLVLADAREQSERGSPRPLLAGAAIYAVAILATATFVLFPLGATDFADRVVDGARVQSDDITMLLRSAAFPLIDRLPWGIGAWFGNGREGAVASACLSVGALALVTLWMSFRPVALVAWALSVVCVSIVALSTGFVTERYAGHLFLAAVLIGWAGKRERRTARSSTARRIAAAGTVGLLCFHAAMGLASVAFDVLGARSPWRTIADEVRARVEEPFHLVATYGHAAGPLGAYLDRPILDLYCPCVTWYTRWDRLSALGTAEADAAYRALACKGDPVVIVVLESDPLPDDERLVPMDIRTDGPLAGHAVNASVFRTRDEPPDPDWCRAEPPTSEP